MDATDDLPSVTTVVSRLRPWRVCAACGHRWKTRATTALSRCRECEGRARRAAEDTSRAITSNHHIAGDRRP
jgi:hypothetical protein